MGRVLKTSEWSADFYGDLASLGEAVEALRQAGAPGDAEVHTTGSGLSASLTARRLYLEDADGDEIDDPDPIVGRARTPGGEA